MKRFWVIALVLISMSARAEAQTAPQFDTLAKQAIVVEATTGDVLLAKDADSQMPTSSMSKTMTMYMVFEAIRNGKLSLEGDVSVSDRAWKQAGSRMFINPGDRVKVEDLIRGVIIQSGNDASVALAEAVGGSETAFAEMMNEKAKAFGLTQTHLANATGMPDPQHYSSARDLATIAMFLMRDFPEYYHYYGEKEFTYNKIKQGNRNPLLYRDIGVDGMKTGHTDAAGYGLIASALRDGRRIVVVVNGLKSMQERADESAKLVDWAYSEYGLYPLLQAEKSVAEAKVWLSPKATIPLAPEKSITKSLPRLAKDAVKVEYAVNAETMAPVHKGQVLGKAVISGLPGATSTLEVPLVAMEDAPQLGLFDRLLARAKRAIGKS